MKMKTQTADAVLVLAKYVCVCLCHVYALGPCTYGFCVKESRHWLGQLLADKYFRLRDISLGRVVVGVTQGRGHHNMFIVRIQNFCRGVTWHIRYGYGLWFSSILYLQTVEKKTNKFSTRLMDAEVVFSFGLSFAATAVCDHRVRSGAGRAGCQAYQEVLSGGGEDALFQPVRHFYSHPRRPGS